MSVSTLLNIGARAMNASYAALQVTGNNVANANTAGYSRQTLSLATALSQDTASGFFGKGVDVVTVTRAHSDFLTREAATTSSLAAADQRARDPARADRDGVPDRRGRPRLRGAAGLQRLRRRLQQAGRFLGAAGRAGARVRPRVAVQTRVGPARRDPDRRDPDLKTAVASVNSLTTRIADLNQRIGNAKATGHEPNDLLDQRDSAVSDLSQLVQVTTVESADGTVGVFLGGSQRLVLGTEATPLATVTDPYDPSKVPSASTTAVPARLPRRLHRRRLGRRPPARAGARLPDARGLIGQLASSIAGALNSQQALGLNLGTPATAGAPLLAIGARIGRAVVEQRVASGVPVASYVNGSGTRVSSVSLTVVNSKELQPSDYELVADPSLPAGSYSLTRLSDGLSQTVTNGSIVDGFRIDIATPAPAARDHFLLKPVSDSTRSISRALDDPKGIAAASPVAAAFATTNTGTATLASLAP